MELPSDEAGAVKASRICHYLPREGQQLGSRGTRQGPGILGMEEVERGQREKPRAHPAEDPVRKLTLCVCDAL